MAKNSKAKVKRANKNNGIDISGELNIPNLTSFETRSEFNKWKKQQKQFTNRKNEIVTNKHGISATKQLIKEITRDTKKAQKIADEQLLKNRDKPVFSGGKQVSTNEQRRMQRMDDSTSSGIPRPKDFNFGNISTKKRLLEKRENMKKRKNPQYFNWRNQLMQNNFTDLLSISLNSHADDLIERLKRIPAEDFVELFDMFPDAFDFDMWDSEGQFIGSDEEARGVVGRMIDAVTSYENGSLNPLFKVRNKK